MNKLLYCLIVPCILMASCVEDEATFEADAGANITQDTVKEEVSDNTEKTRQDAITSCRQTCTKKFEARCPQMDTYTERQACYDTCEYTQTYPTACEAQYIALNICRTTPLRAYTCNSSGAPVPTASCIAQSVNLQYCILINS